MTVLLLTLAYVAIAALLLNLGLRSHWHWHIKLAAVLISAIFYFGTWVGLLHLQGWPVDEQVPDHFRLISEVIEQPDKHSGTEGAIYLWLIDLADGADSRPRAYRLPYNEVLHEDIVKATASGKSQIGRRVENTAGNRTEGQPGTIKFEDEPKPRLPSKY